MSKERAYFTGELANESDRRDEQFNQLNCFMCYCGHLEHCHKEVDVYNNHPIPTTEHQDCIHCDCKEFSKP